MLLKNLNLYEKVSSSHFKCLVFKIVDIFVKATCAKRKIVRFIYRCAVVCVLSLL